MTAGSGTNRPDYGLDAPGVVRNLVLVAAAGLTIWLTSAFGWWSGRIVVGQVRIALAGSVVWPAISCALMAVWMAWHSRIGKIRGRERLLDLVPWTGTEQVLDVGCGRGLMLIGAAKRLASGRAIGVDIWQAEDLSGNKPEATLLNAELEGVRDRVEVRTADMRQLPFADRTFDTVVSSAAIHNLYAAGDRAKAINEIARVLEPGGRAVIDDIRHLREFQRLFEAAGCAVSRRGSKITTALLAVITFGSLRPGTIVVRKSGGR